MNRKTQKCGTRCSTKQKKKDNGEDRETERKLDRREEDWIDTSFQNMNKIQDESSEQLVDSTYNELISIFITLKQVAPPSPVNHFYACNLTVLWGRSTKCFRTTSWDISLSGVHAGWTSTSACLCVFLSHKGRNRAIPVQFRTRRSTRSEESR